MQGEEELMNIPKVIHYCWFGKGKMPNLAEKCIESWKKFFTDYQIKECEESKKEAEKRMEYRQSLLLKKLEEFAPCACIIKRIEPLFSVS
mgnify:CR=1 FL=1